MAPPGADGDGDLLPDTATEQPMSPLVLGSLLLLVGGIGVSAVRRSEDSTR